MNLLVLHHRIAFLSASDSSPNDAAVWTICTKDPVCCDFAIREEGGANFALKGVDAMLRPSCAGCLDDLSKLFTSNPGCFPTEREENSHYNTKTVLFLCMEMPQSSQQAPTCTQHFQADSRELHSLCITVHCSWQGMKSMQKFTDGCKGELNG